MLRHRLHLSKFAIWTPKNTKPAVESHLPQPHLVSDWCFGSMGQRPFAKRHSTTSWLGNVTGSCLIMTTRHRFQQSFNYPTCLLLSTRKWDTCQLVGIPWYPSGYPDNIHHRNLAKKPCTKCWVLSINGGKIPYKYPCSKRHKALFS
jgi:hypothetical protein